MPFPSNPTNPPSPRICWQLAITRHISINESLITFMVNLHDLKALRLLILLRKQARSRPFLNLKSTRLSQLLASSLSNTSSTPKHTFTTMSWMDSWSRPSKHQSVPAPFYLLSGGETTPYCHSCGRVINSRRKGQQSLKDDAESKTPVKYCSASCRSRKPGRIDREIEAVILRFLQGEEKPSPLDESSKRTQKSKKGSGGKRAKGDQRLLISCDDVENFVFGPTDGGGSTAGSGSEDSHEGESEGESGNVTGTAPEAASSAPQSMVHNSGTLIDPTEDAAPYVDGDVLARMSIRSGTRIRPPQSTSEVNGSVGGEKGRAERIDETDEMLEKRRQGQKKARQREMVRCAARRAVVFGLVAGDGQGEGKDTRKCEAVMNGKVVEPSFAKGSWGIRWRG